MDDILGTNIFDNPIIASKKEELKKKRLINFQDSLNLIKIKEQNIYNPIEPKIIDIDWTVSVTDSGYLVQIQDITKQKFVEDSLKESESTLRSFFDATGDMRGIIEVISENDIRHVADNVITAGYLGITPDMMRNKLSSELGEPEEIIHRWIRHYRESKRTSKPVSFEYLDERENKEAWLVATVNYIGTNSQGQSRYGYIVRDITKHKKAEIEVVRSNQKISEIIESIQDNFYVLDYDWNYVHINKQSATIIGLEPQDFIGQNHWKMFPQYRGTVLEDNFHEAMEKREVRRFEIHSPYNDNWFIVTVYPSAEGITVLGSNITERRKVEDYAKELLKKEQKLTEELQSSNEELESITKKLQDSNEKIKYHRDRLLESNKALNDSQSQFKLLINTLEPAVALLNEIGEFILVNPSFMRMFGLGNEVDILNVYNQDWSQWEVYGEDGHLLHVDEHPVRKVVLTGKPILNQIVGMKNPGSDVLIWILVSANPLLNVDGSINKIICTYNDITKIKKTEKKLNESEERYHKLFTSMTEMFQIIELIYDTKGKPVNYFYRDVNPAFCNLVGKTEEQLIGKRVKDIFGIVEDYWLEKYDEVAKTGNPIQFENYGAELDKWYEVNVWKVMENQVAIIFTDTTERKHREESEKKFIDELTRSNVELERFAYVSSHDLQEPLRMVTLYSQLLERRYKDSLDSDADDFIGYIVENAKRMKQLIDDLLEYSRVSSQAKEFENVDIEKILDIVLTNLSVPIAENNAKITYEPLPTAYVDKNQMLQVFQNLITNAIKFRGDKSPEINISAQREQTEWIFSISDNGIGIKPEHQKQIFDVFKRLHTREEYPGTGIGLSIVKKIINQHGGNIWVESELGKGSTFYFKIPI